jgi:restriction endonuclease S subunit
MAQNVTDRVDPAEADGDVYVGLEHLDAESLKIRRWGTPADVIGQKLRFRKGDIIFGKRRAYQRKLAVAECDGICSAHAMVVRAKPKVVLPEFLPFLMQSDMFMDRAVEISVGSLSPTINWTTLKVQEFPLPPLDEQRRIAEILWAAVEAVMSWELSCTHLVDTADTWASQYLRGSWDNAKLGSLLVEVQYGSSKRVEPRSPSSLPILRIPNVIGGRIDLSGLGWVELPDGDVNKYLLQSGDVLIVRTNGNPDYVGRTAVADGLPDSCVYASYLIRLRCDTDKLLPTYLHAAMSSSLLRRTLRHEIRSSAGNYNLNTKGIKRQAIPLPPIAAQHEFVAQFSAFQKQVDRLQEHASASRKLRQELTNYCLGGSA